MKQDDLREFIGNVFNVFDAGSQIGAIYALASIFRKEISEVTGVFPSLFITGPAATGKTEIARSLISFYDDPYRMISSRSQTPKETDRMVTEWDKPLVHIDDYVAGSKFNHLLSKWAQTADCGILITTQEEMPVMDDKSVLSILPVYMKQRKYDLYSVENFRRLQEIRDKVIKINHGDMLLPRKLFDKFFAKTIVAMMELLSLTAVPEPADPMIIRLWSIIPATYIALSDWLYPIDFSKLQIYCRAGIAYHDAILRNSREEGGEI